MFVRGRVISENSDIYVVSDNDIFLFYFYGEENELEDAIDIVNNFERTDI